MKRFLVLAALFALAAPAAFAAPRAGTGKPETSASSSSGQGPAALCREQLRTMGATNFQSTYAPNGKGKNAFGKCVSRQSQLVADDQKNAAKACKAERGTTEESVKAFNDTYGTNANKKNAFGKCVSKKAHELTEDAQDATLNAAKKCKAERGTTADSAKAFADTYGTNANKRNAFGKCVSMKAKEQGDSND
jgi:Tfp pilus assembly protein PilV